MDCVTPHRPEILGTRPSPSTQPISGHFQFPRSILVPGNNQYHLPRGRGVSGNNGDCDNLKGLGDEAISIVIPF